MLLQLLKWIKGYIFFEVIGKFPERFINLTMSRGISIWGLDAQNKSIKGKISIADYRTIRPIAKRAKVRVKIRKKHGLPFFAKNHRHRIGVLIGAACFFIAIFVLSSHVWAININGLESISYTDMMKTLNQSGLVIGVKSDDLQIPQMERKIYLNQEKVGWISINIEGSVANVEIKEKALKNIKESNKKYCNIIAKKDGVIEKINAYNGKTMIFPGSAVTKGQVIVSGKYTDALENVYKTEADAKVFAKTYETKYFYQNFEKEMLIPTGEIYYKENAQVLLFNFPIAPSYLPIGKYEKQYYKEMFKTEKAILPLGLIKEENIEYKNTILIFSEKQAKEAINKKMAVYEVLNLANAQVEKRTVTYKSENGKLIGKVEYVLLEDISQKSFFN